MQSAADSRIEQKETYFTCQQRACRCCPTEQFTHCQACCITCRFTLYELGGVVTNLLAGIAGSRWGIRSTLLTGLSLQIASIGMLYGWKPEWSKKEGIIYVTFAQLLAGVAKDLTKLGGKTVAKLVTPDEKQSYLFKLVSFITGACSTVRCPINALTCLEQN